VTLAGYPAYAATVRGASIDVRSAPSARAVVVVRLPRTNENGAPQTFLIKGKAADPSGAMWYHVLLPIRPNGSMGWIRASDVDVAGLRYSLVVHLRSFHLDLFDNDRFVASYPIGVGADNTPTPSGSYYIKELIQPPDPNTIYGHYVFGLNGFSNVLLDWPQGGVLGIHGTNDLGSIGRRVSHGCIRTTNAAIDHLASILPLGTPVRVEDS
jgi:hypothetical protein